MTIPTLERLEDRQLFAAFPTPYEQYVLQLINRARANPNGEVTRLSSKTWGDNPSLVPATQFPQSQTPSLNEGLPAGTIASSAKPPLAFNGDLTQAARDYSQTLLDNSAQLAQQGTPLTHTFNGTSPTSRDQAAGYQGVSGENLGVQASSQSLPIATGVSETLHDNLFVDNNVTGRGHRTNLLNTTSGYREIGIGLAASTHYAGLGQSVPDGVMLTEDFGVPQSSSAILLGVAFKDTNSDAFYEPGEQLGGVAITATRASDNAVFSTTTWDAGGYSLPLAPGTYSVVASGGGLTAPVSSTVTIGTANIEQDFVNGAQNVTPPVVGPVVVNPVITTQPQSQTVISGATATFTAAAAASPTATIQWQVSVNHGAFTDIPGATDSTLSVATNVADSGNRYQAVFTTADTETTLGGTATSHIATLTVNVPAAPAAISVALSGSLAPAIAGQKTAAVQTLRITNTGGQLIKGAVSVTLYVSPDPALDGAQTQVVTLFPKVNLKPGLSTSVAVKLKRIPAVAAGSYFVLATVATGSLSSLAVAGAPVSIAAPFVALSASAQVAPVSATPGKKALVRAAVTNAGNIAAVQRLTLALSASTDASGAGATSLGELSPAINLKAGQTKILKLPVLIPPTLPAGSYFFFATLDNT